MKIWQIGFSLGFLAAVALPMAAQDVPASVSETVDVRVVNVEAVVTDRQGTRVHGLAAEDFRLLVDGEEVPIEFFTEIRGGLALDAVQPSRAQFTPIAPGEALGTSYLVFVDEFFTLTTDRRTVLRRLVEDLAFLTPEDRMAIVAWDGSRLDMLSSWNSSHRVLRDTLQRAMERPARGLEREAERRLVDRSPRFASAVFREGELNIEERIYVSRLTDQLERGVRAATATLRSFAQPNGRKVMLLVSGGWPWSPADFVDGTPFGAFYERNWYEQGEELYAPLSQTANLLGYTLYPVDAPGLESTSGVSASRAGFVGSSLSELNYYQERELHDSLRYLAGETGGRALLNGKRAHALEEVQADTRSFYWLGFTPDRLGDDGEREIEVELLSRGLELRTRSGYADLSKESEVAMAVESALLFGSPAGESDLMMEFGAPQRAGRGKVAVPLVIHIPIDEIALLPTGENEYVAQLALRIAVLDDRGARSDISNIPLEVRRSELPEPGDSLAYETTLRMRSRPHDLVVAVYDESTGAMLSGAAELGL